jgi:hypothetical protein
MQGYGEYCEAAGAIATAQYNDDTIAQPCQAARKQWFSDWFWGSSAVGFSINLPMGRGGHGFRPFFSNIVDR